MCEESEQIENERQIIEIKTLLKLKGWNLYNTDLEVWCVCEVGVGGHQEMFKAYS